MKAILQRVQRGSVSVADEVVGEVGVGYVILLGVTHGDGPEQVRELAEKMVHLRVFEDDEGKMNRSALDCAAEILVISQFTLYANAKKGQRPSFTGAAPPDVAEPLVRQFVAQLKNLGIHKVETGVFGAEMMVHIENNGPVTIVLDTDLL